MTCSHCGKGIRVIWSSHKFTAYSAPDQVSAGKAGAFCNARTDNPCHEPRESE